MPRRSEAHGRRLRSGGVRIGLLARRHPLPAAIGAALSISAAARHTGITVATLRMWQTRYGLGPSLTTPGGHRRYTAGDIQRLNA